MDNITILASESVMVPHPAGLVFVAIGIFLMIFSVFFLGITDETKRAIIIAAVGCAMAFGGLIFSAAVKVEDYIEYKILISEEVSFKEVYNKYEILETEGDIFVVKEREVEDND